MTLPVRKTPYLITYRRFTNDELGNTLSKMYAEVAFAVNERSIGIFDKFLMVTGNKWFNNEEQQERRQEFRRVYEFTNQVASFTIPHELTDIDYFTRIYGTAITPTNFIPLPFVSITAATSIEINVDSSNINILLDASSPSLTKGLIVLEYVMNN
jgi:hypothetical protein